MDSVDMPMVSVCMITYNHERFIAQAIESVLMQKVQFGLELVIGEDGSADQTRQIIQTFASKYPFIRPLFREKNLGMKQNFVDTILQCRGKYIALLEGDDYWIDPYKIQKQVDFLDANPDYIIVGANALSVREDENFSKARLMFDAAESFDFDTARLIESNPYPTLTVIFRNHILKSFPDIYFTGSGGDRRLYLLLSQYGKCRFINDVVGVYRIHANSVTNLRNALEPKNSALEERIRNARTWNQYFSNQYAREERRVQSNAAQLLMIEMLRQRRLLSAIRYSLLIDPEDIESRRARQWVYRLQKVGRMFRLKAASV
jgi:glycosyltransferase involved in cell wall biosynthesis